MKNLILTTTYFGKGTVAILCLVLTCLFFISGCKKDNDPIEKPIPCPVDIHYDEYQAHVPLSAWINLNYDEKVIIINSEEKLKTYLDPNVNPMPGGYSEVDFSKYSVLLVSGRSENTDAYITKKLQKISDGKYKLDAEIFLNPVNTNKNWHFAIRIEKISDESSIELKTKTSMGESDYYYNNNGEKMWLAVRKDFIIINCKSETDVIALCEKTPFLQVFPFEYTQEWFLARINPLQIKLDELLQNSEIVSAAYGLEYAELVYGGLRRVSFPVNSITIKHKEGLTPEHILEEIGLTGYVEEINTHNETSTIFFNIELSEILRISRELFESGLCVEAIPGLTGGIEPYK
jgi:hypothetical protein